VRVLFYALEEFQVCTEFCKTELRKEPQNKKRAGVAKTAWSWHSERELRVCDTVGWLSLGKLKYYFKKLRANFCCPEKY
jgi:isopropylmalate/homocitrate/citramalate synthase